MGKRHCLDCYYCRRKLINNTAGVPKGAEYVCTMHGYSIVIAPYDNYCRDFLGCKKITMSMRDVYAFKESARAFFYRRSRRTR